MVRWMGTHGGTARDDSDFLYDANYGSTLLLPNRNLDGAYQRIDLSGGYHVTSMLSANFEAQNLLSEHYAEAFAAMRRCHLTFSRRLEAYLEGTPGTRSSQTRHGAELLRDGLQQAMVSPSRARAQEATARWIALLALLVVLLGATTLVALGVGAVHIAPTGDPGARGLRSACFAGNRAGHSARGSAAACAGRGHRRRRAGDGGTYVPGTVS